MLWRNCKNSGYLQIKRKTIQSYIGGFQLSSAFSWKKRCLRTLYDFIRIIWPIYQRYPTNLSTYIYSQHIEYTSLLYEPVHIVDTSKISSLQVPAQRVNISIYFRYLSTKLIHRLYFATLIISSDNQYINIPHFSYAYI